MSSLGTSSPVSASTFMYLIRWPVFRLSWLNETFSLSEVAGYSATGQVTRDRRRKPFQLARGAMGGELRILMLDSRRTGCLGSDSIAFPTRSFLAGHGFPHRISTSADSTFCSCYVLIKDDERSTRELAHADAKTD